MKLFLHPTRIGLILYSIIFILGCSTENPLCTENYCVEGEIYPRSDLPAGQTFGDLPIDDTTIFAAIVGGATPMETTPEDPTIGNTLLKDINSYLPGHIPKDPSLLFDAINTDIPTGSRFFIGKTVLIRATVDVESLQPRGLDEPEQRSYISLNRIDIRDLGKTDPGHPWRDIEEIIWRIHSPEDSTLLNRFKKGEAYDFHVSIQNILIRQYSDSVDSYYSVLCHYIEE
ncbi:MAG: hypothetical protein OXI63_01665 [Candidatus Poribacteria bacterium]|nr:hypothetical protein [Candidatus Poribacteria bacterium]